MLKRVLATRNEILSMLAPQRLSSTSSAVDSGNATHGNSAATRVAAVAACRQASGAQRCATCATDRNRVPVAPPHADQCARVVMGATVSAPWHWYVCQSLQRGLRAGDRMWTLQAPQRHFDVSVSVLEVQNVPSRHSLGAAITANDAPLPSVVVSAGPVEHVWTATARGTSATFDTTERCVFTDLPANAKVLVSLADGADRSYATTRGVVTLALGALDLFTPKYVWLEVEQAQSEAPLSRSGAPAAVLRMLSDGSSALKSTFGVTSAPPDLGFDPEQRRQGPMLVHMRLAATPRTTVAPTVIASVDLAGMGLLVSSGFDEELMAVSFHSLALSAELAQRQAMLSAMVQGVQIDDQSLDARQPVVLSRANPMTKGLLPDRGQV